jgi:hypothetical protein
MACCGQKRSQVSMSGQAAPQASRVVAMPSPAFLFEYTGETSVIVIGSMTGKRYRFTGPGARAQIDAMDVPSLAGVPNLARVGRA